jgi:hypothetical protein
LEELTPDPFCCPECASDALAYLDENEHEWFEETGKLPCYSKGHAF